MGLPLQLGNRSGDVLLVQRFLIKHGFLTFLQVNQHPGYFDPDTADALKKFYHMTGAHVSGDVGTGKLIDRSVLDAMVGWENNYHRFYRGPSTTYVLNPTNEVLTDTTTGKTVPLASFHPKRVTFTLDPGHGVHKAEGNDPGSHNGKFIEADITRAVAMNVASAINARGFDVIVTRDAQQYPKTISGGGFQFRTHAGRASTAGFISLHADIGPDGNASGTRIFSDERLNGHSASAALRMLIAHHDKGDVIYDTKNREERYLMISPISLGPVMPAVLIEMGFLTNPHDLARLTNPQWRKKFATELAGNLTQSVDMRQSLSNLRDNKGPAPLPIVAMPTQPQGYSYGVEPGDSVNKIARHYGLDPKHILQANPSARKGIFPNEELILTDLRELTVPPHSGLFHELHDFVAHDKSLKHGEKPLHVMELANLVARINDIPVDQVKVGVSLAMPKNMHMAEEMLGRLPPLPAQPQAPVPTKQPAPIKLGNHLPTPDSKHPPQPAHKLPLAPTPILHHPLKTQELPPAPPPPPIHYRSKSQMDGPK